MMRTEEVVPGEERTSPAPARPVPVVAAPTRPPRKRVTRARGLALVAVALVAAAVGAWRWRASARPKAPQLETVQVDRGRIVAKVTATGTLAAIVTVQVGSQVSGRVQSLYADFNSRVKKGQLIAKIDPQLFEAAREQARANLVAAEGNLAKAQAQAVDAQRQYRRNQELAAQKLIAQADLDTAQSNADAAAAQVRASQGSVEQARASLHQAMVNLEYTNIISPTNGTVISRNVDTGQTVAASLQAPTLFVIAEDLSKMEVDTSVSEADVGRLQDGMAATFTVDAYPTETFQARVRQIRNAPQTVQNVVTYNAVVDVDNPELKLRPGMTANVTFVYAEKSDALRVPNAALRFKPPPELTTGQAGRGAGQGQGVGGAARPGGAGQAVANRPRGGGKPDQRTVWVVRDGKATPVAIKTGISDGSVTEVVEGDLRPGDHAITDVVGGTSASASGMAGAMRRPF